MSRRTHLRLATVFASAILVCSTATWANTSAPTPSSAALKLLQSEIGEPRCETDQHCRTVAVGAKACGGPTAYLAWSTLVSKEARIQQLAKAQVQAQEREVRATGMASNCAMLMDPGARCLPPSTGTGPKRCELAPADAGMRSAQ